MLTKEEVREDLIYMQAGLQVPYCCQPATYVNTTHMDGTMLY
jgi:hypothetical protein